MKLDELRALCAKATPGPWHQMAGAAWNVLHDKGYRIITCGTDMRTDGEADAAYIAAFNPETVKLLLDVAEAAQEAVANDDEWGKFTLGDRYIPPADKIYTEKMRAALAALEDAP